MIPITDEADVEPALRHPHTETARAMHMIADGRIQRIGHSALDKLEEWLLGISEILAAPNVQPHATFRRAGTRSLLRLTGRQRPPATSRPRGHAALSLDGFAVSIIREGGLR